MRGKTKILIFCDWFEPGFRAGGPIRSIYNFASSLSNELDIYIITSDRDLGDINKYPDVEINCWINKNGYKVHYIGLGETTLKRIKFLIREIQPDWIYLNSMFSFPFSVKPLLASCFLLDGPYKILLAPRGMLKQTALQFKPLKKQIFLKLFASLGLNRKIIFQATSEEEKADIAKIMGVNTRTIVLPNLAPANESFEPIKDKMPGQLRLIFIGRIHPIKNLHYVLHVLRMTEGDLHLTIVGKIEDQEYWNSCKQLLAEIKNLKTEIHHEVPHNEINKLLLDHHMLILPTQGENYGHAISESLKAGRPVLISDQTPWRNLTKDFAGWDISLNKMDCFKEIVNMLRDMDTVEINRWALSAWKYSNSLNNMGEMKNRYLNFFSRHYE